MNKYLRFALIGLGGLIVLLIVVPLLVPTEGFLMVTEKLASHVTGMSVKIKRLSLRTLPQPMVLVEGLTIRSEKDDTPRVAIASGRALIALWPLFYGHMEFTGIRLRDVILNVSKQISGKNVRIVHVDMLRGSIKPKKGESRHSYWNARMYGGIIHMDATISISKGAQRRVSARMKMDDIQVQPLLADVAGIEKVSGMLSSTLTIEATGVEAKQIRGALRIDGPIHMTDVKIANTDASHILKDKTSGQVKLQLKQKPAGFRFLNLVLHIRGRDASLEDIVLYSSRLEATGKITIKNGSQLEGKIIPSGLPGLIGMTMLVSGTLEHPEMHPAPPDMKGAATGAVAESNPEDRQ